MCICVRKMQDMGTQDRRKLLGLRGTLLLVSVIGLCLVVLFLSTHRQMCACVRKMRDMGTLNSRKLLGLRGTLFLVSVIGLCSGVLFLCNFDTQTYVCVCMEHARQGYTGQKKIALAEGNPPLGLCDWTLSFLSFSKTVVMENARQGNTGRKKIAWAEGNPPLCLCDWILSC